MVGWCVCGGVGEGRVKSSVCSEMSAYVVCVMVCIGSSVGTDGFLMGRECWAGPEKESWTWESECVYVRAISELITSK